MVWDHLYPKNLLAQYDETYFINENPKGGYSNYFEGMKINRKTFVDRLKRIEKFLGRKGAILDVGCALGDSLKETERLGWPKPQGLEPSRFAYQFARKRGLNLKNGTLEDIFFPPKSFDVVLYQDVMEHIANPLKQLRQAYKIIKPSGLLFIVTPDIGGFWSKILGPLWFHLKPGEHINYFSQKSLRLLLEKAKFEKIEIRRTYHVLSVKYSLNKLRYYSPAIFEFLIKVAEKFRLSNTPFRAYTGELEAWAWKRPSRALTI